MAVTYSETLRHARLDAVTAAVGDAGLLRIYNGTRPAAGGAATTLISEHLCGTPFAGAAASNTLTANAIADDTALATEIATWFRITTSGGAYVIDGDAGTAGTELILDDSSIVTGGTVSISSLVVTGGNLTA